jgi:hypothetical protein
MHGRRTLGPLKYVLYLPHRRGEFALLLPLADIIQDGYADIRQGKERVHHGPQIVKSLRAASAGALPYFRKLSLD